MIATIIICTFCLGWFNYLLAKGVVRVITGYMDKHCLKKDDSINVQIEERLPNPIDNLTQYTWVN